MSRELPDNVFRANVGAVIMNASGEVLALERKDIPGAWQLPQGGLREGEEPLEAVYREVEEETGIGRSKLRLVDEYPDWLAYELSGEQRRGKHGRGQVQKWFLFLLVSPVDEDIVDVANVQEPEFSAWKWMTLKKLADQTVSFRKPIYSKLVKRFSPHLKP